MVVAGDVECQVLGGAGTGTGLLTTRLDHRVGARNPVPMTWAPKGRGEPVAQPATRGVHVTSVAGFVLGKGPDAAEEERWRRG